ncbi:MAG: hypothetical protein OEY14_01155, partial [Myxococcales bacterium]|nr:hypothetical protein [Myxococcales bacterium]
YPGSDPVLGLLDVCRRAGNLPLGAFCSQASDCESALCDAPTSRCTRRCADGLCPSGWICAPVPGYAVQICRP